MNKQTFLIVDTETTISQTVADFGAVIVDRAGTCLLYTSDAADE